MDEVTAQPATELLVATRNAVAEAMVADRRRSPGCG